MRRWRHTANVSFYGARHDRFMVYQPAKPLVERIKAAAATPGISGVELKYPADFKDLAELRAVLAGTGLPLSAVNVDSREMPAARHGSLSARDPETRARVIARLKEGMDVAAEFGTDVVTTCPNADGYDYPFQLDFVDAWGNFVDSARTAASHRDDVRLALEYQFHEPHAKIMLRDVGRVLAVCLEAGRANLGANLDIGHCFAAQEAPAEAAAMLARHRRLFYVHTSDNPGDGGDWDMISGSVHVWHWIELLMTLDQVGYGGWLGADLMPKVAEASGFYAANARIIDSMAQFVERVGEERLRGLRGREGAAPEVFSLLADALAGGGSGEDSPS